MRSGTFQNSGIEKAFLFDVVSKIYIATDSSPVDMQSYELCCDMIDVVIDISCIYRWVHSLPAVSIHWVPLTTSNLIHKNVLVITGTRCMRTFGTLMPMRSFPCYRTKSACYNRVVVLTELAASGTRCILKHDYFTSCTFKKSLKRA